MPRFVVENLEGRLLFTWSSYAQLVHEDAAAKDFSNITGKGVTVALIDTGIDYKLAALGGGVGAKFKVVAGYNFVDNNSNFLDVDGHGTDTAFTVAGNPITKDGITYQGVAPDAHLIGLKAGTESGGFSDTDITSALQWVIDNYKKYGISIVNMSIGSGSYTTAQTQSPESEDLARLHDLGIMVIAASGNSNDSNFDPISQDGIAFPASDPSVFAVGAVDSTDTLTSWGQRGSELDLLAPGVQIVMPDITSTTGGTVAEDGTSFSSPYTVGTAALIKQADPSATPGDIGSILMSSGKDIRDGSQNSGSTTGLLFSRLDIDSALKLTARRVGVSKTLSLGSTFSTALDSNGVLHAAYYDPKHHDVLYATRDVSGLWSKAQVIDSTGNVGSQLSIAVDTTGKPGIAYYDASNTALKFASYSGKGWSTATIDSSKTTGQNPSVAFSIYGDAYVGYYRRTGGLLRLATESRDAGTWTVATVDGGSANVGAALSLDVNEAAVSSNGFFTQYDTTVALAYTDSTNHDLKYARLDVVDPTATWYTAVVDNVDANGISLHLHAGPQEVGTQAQISYRDAKTGEIKYAYRYNTWFTETVTKAKTSGNTELSFTTGDAPIVSYYDRTHKAVYSATRISSTSYSAAREAASGGLLSVSLNQRTGASLLTTLDREKTGVASLELV